MAIERSPPFFFMSNLLFAIALTLVSGHDVAGEMPFAIPALRVSGSEILRPTR